jgi:hypothetical protein
MSLPTSTLATYESIGNREDLTDMIYNISPTDTPILSAVEVGKATATKHEWQTAALTAADTSNRVLEGDDATTDASNVTVRLDNICQISDKVGRVTGTQQAIDKAGRDDELAYQEVMKGKELKIDMEALLFGAGANTAKDVGADATARVTAGILCWLKTNISKGTGSAADPSAATGAYVRTDGTQRVFAESQLKSVLQSCWTNGGKPETIFVGGFNKQAFSGFTGRASPTEDTSKKKIVASVTAYESDFGTVKVVPARNMRSRDALVLQTDMWKICYMKGRKFVTIPLARTGDSERFQMLSEYTLECCNEKASGLIADLTTA